MSSILATKYPSLIPSLRPSGLIHHFPSFPRSFSLGPIRSLCQWVSLLIRPFLFLSFLFAGYNNGWKVQRGIATRPCVESRAFSTESPRVSWFSPPLSALIPTFHATFSEVISPFFTSATPRFFAETKRERNARVSLGKPRGKWVKWNFLFRPGNEFSNSGDSRRRGGIFQRTISRTFEFSSDYYYRDAR